MANDSVVRQDDTIKNPDADWAVLPSGGSKSPSSEPTPASTPPSNDTAEDKADEDDKEEVKEDKGDEDNKEEEKKDNNDEAGKEEEEKEPEQDKGEICQVKELYTDLKTTCSCCINWVEEKPFKKEEDDKKKKAETKYATFAINYRMIPHGTDGAWKTHSIVVHSSRIQKVLKVVFEGYPVSYATDFELVLHPNFVPFFHRWDKLLEAEKAEEDEETKSHVELLRKLLEKELADTFERIALVNKTGVAEFKDLEYIVKPGQVMINNSNENVRAGILKDIKLIPQRGCSPEHYAMVVESVDWNGTRFGTKSDSWTMNYFRGGRLFQDMKIFPLDMHPEGEKFRTRLVERGRAFEKLQGQHFKAYDGPVTPMGWGGWRERRVSQRPHCE